MQPVPHTAPPSRYSERTLLLLLAAVQFTHILDFMVIMPLGEQLMRELAIGPTQFSHLVAAYTASAGIVGLLTAPFMDRFDRRKVLLIAYAGFFVGTPPPPMSGAGDRWSERLDHPAR